MSVFVEANGRVSDGRIVWSSGDSMLDYVAVRAMKTCSFVPATSGGQPVAQWTPMQYIWSLDND
jgi:TonB family protein